MSGIKDKPQKNLLQAWNNAFDYYNTPTSEGFIKDGASSMTLLHKALETTGMSMGKVKDSTLELIQAAGNGKVKIDGLTNSMKLASVASKALAMVGNMLVTALASLAVTAAIKGIEYLANYADHMAENLEETKDKVAENESAIADMNTELEETSKLIKELEGLSSLTPVQQEQLNLAIQQREELERRLAVEQALLRVNQRQKNDDYTKAFNSRISENAGAQSVFDSASNTALQKQFEADAKAYGVDSAFTKGIDLFDAAGSGTMGTLGYTNAGRFEANRALYKQNLEEIKKLRQDTFEAEVDGLDDAVIKYDNKIAELEAENAALINNMSEYVKQLQDAAEGISYIEGDHLTVQEKATNDRLDYTSYVGEAFADLENTARAQADFDAVFESDVFSEQTKQLKELASAGELTAESLSAEEFKGIMSEWGKLGWTAEQVAEQVNSNFSGTGDGVTTTADSLYSSLFKNSEAYTKLTEAMNEQNETGVLSFETYKGLIEANSEFAELLTLTADGWMLNTEAAWTYIEAQDEMSKSEALSHIQDLYEQLAENPDDTGIQNEIDRFAALIREIDSATGALSKFKKAQQTENQDADFNVGEEAYSVLNEGNKTGKTGTDEFQEAVGFMLGENWKTTYADNIDQAYKDAEELGKRYFGQSDERTGMANFRDDLVKQGLGSFDGETFELFDGVTLEDTAEKLGMSYDAVKSMFGLMEAYGAEIEFPFKLTDDDIKNIEEYKENLTKEELTSGIDQLNDKAEEYQEILSSADPNSEEYAEAQEGLENVTKATEVLQGELDSINGEGVEIEPETMNLDQLYQRLQELETAVTTLQDLKITVPTEITGDIATIKQLINGKEFEKHGVLSPTDKVSPKINELETGDFESTIGVKANAADLVNTDSQIDNVANEERTAYIKIVPDGTVDLEEGETIESKVEGTGFTATKQDDGSYKWTDPISYFNGVVNKLATETGKIPSQDSVMDRYEQDVANGLVAFGEATHNATDLISSALQIFTENAWANGPDGGVTEDGVEGNTITVDKVDVESEATEEATEIIQDKVESNPIEMPVCIDEPLFQEAVEDVTEENPATITVEPEVSPMPSLGDAGIPPQPTQIEVGADTSDGKAEIAELEGDAKDPVQKPLSIDASSAWSTLSSLVSSLTQTVTKTVRVVYTGIRNSFATGTKNAPGGLSLVDDGTGSNAGAELIVHNKQGTYELGSGDGPRVTHLDKGDTVYTAKQTKSILAKAAKVGGFFRDGLNNAKAWIGNAFATGVSGSMSWSKINQTLSASTSYKGKTSNSRRADRGWDKYVEKLFDWIEVRLEVLQTKTEKWMLAASEAVGYIAKNAELDKALSSTTQQIDETLQAYERYIVQANEIAQKANLSADIVKKIQEGTIDIESYDEDLKNKIKAYQEWYDKSQQCVKSLTDLREQERELATQKLDNIINHHQWRIDRLDSVIDINESTLKLKAATGIRITEDDYDKSIDATTQKIQELINSKSVLSEELADMVKKGYIVEGSEQWYEYTKKLEELDKTVIDTKTNLQELVDTSNNINLTNLKYALTALETSASKTEQMMSLHEAQGRDNTESDYEELIKNGMAQIKNLEAQNEDLIGQQAGLDKLSEKYQDLQKQIDDNNKSILNMKTSQEQWNDSVVGLKINELEKYKTQLSKTNDEYQRQRDLQQSIEDLERARTQRTQRVFRDGLGFVFEQDQDAVLDAQKNLEDVVQSQLLGKIDELIEALEESKKDTNVYDENGVLLGKEYSLPVLESFAELFKNSGKNDDVVSAAMADARKAAYEQIFKGITTNSDQTSFQIGDIIIQNADSPESLANAILDNFPNAIMQALYSKS